MPASRTFLPTLSSRSSRSVRTRAAVSRSARSPANPRCRSATGITRTCVGESQDGNWGTSCRAVCSSRAQITRSTEPVGEQWRIGGKTSSPSWWYLIPNRSADSTSIWTVGFSIGRPWPSMVARSIFAIQ